jgi:hypothetical protein
MNQNRSYKFSIAPMMEWTDRHCRFFHRLLTRRALIRSARDPRGGDTSGSDRPFSGAVCCGLIEACYANSDRAQSPHVFPRLFAAGQEPSPRRRRSGKTLAGKSSGIGARPRRHWRASHRSGAEALRRSAHAARGGSAS